MLNFSENNLPKTLYSVYVPNRSCNLKCEYCATGESSYLRDLPDCGYIKQDRNNEILAKSRNIYNSEILKIVGGGEIFLDSKLEEWVIQEENNYGAILILTNGVAIGKKKIEALSQMNNLYLGISLDGYLYETNCYRFPKVEVFYRVLDTFYEIGNRNIPLQVNMVMHDKNDKDFFEYLDFLKETGFTITLHMSPVMPKNSVVPVNQEQVNWINNLEKLLKEYEKYRDILLPKAYYRHLIQYYSNAGKRTCRCYIPYYMVQLFSSGDITACPIVWNQNIGNVRDYGDDLFSERIYKLLSREGNRPLFCRKCIASYDILSLYTKGEITEEEITTLPLFSSKRVIEQIKTIKGILTENKQ